RNDQDAHEVLPRVVAARPRQAAGGRLHEHGVLRGSCVNPVRRIINRVRIARLRRAGLDLHPDASLVDVPDFGSEPWLVSIGPFARISGQVAFITHDGATWTFRDRPELSSLRRFGRIVVKQRAFVGYRSTILPGVTLGERSVV